MFTGLIQELGVVQALKRGADSARLAVSAPGIIKDIQLGDSIAVNGVCLTVVSSGRDVFWAEVMAETMAKTNLGHLRSGDRVNLELALKLGDRMGGHLVSGHIDGVGMIAGKAEYDIATVFTIHAPEEVMVYLVKKGSVAVDGISLTVVDIEKDSFRVSLIPHTTQATTLGYKKYGDTVNLEADLIGKYVERLLNHRKDIEEKKGITFEFLAEHGFK